MSLGDRLADFLYRIVTGRGKLKILLTPVGLFFWFGFGVLIVFVSLWLDRLLSARIPLAAPINLFISVPILVIGAAICLGTVLQFLKARGSPVPLNPPKKLVVTGLYSYVRNPMLLGWFLILFGTGILLYSISLTFILTPLFIMLNILYLKTVEEKEMEKKFGQEYVKYKESVSMFIPKVGRKC